MNLWLADYIAMANDCVEQMAKLTPKEQATIKIIKHRLDTTESITPRQVGMLNKIWKKVVRNR